MQVVEISMRVVRPGVMALLLVATAEAAAQAYRPASLERFEQAPMDLQALAAFDERRAERSSSLERSERWMLYGRFGLLNFQNELDPNGGGVQVGWRRAGPALGTKIYVGIHRRF